MEREILKAALAPGGDCPSLERLGMYADGTLASGEQAAAAAHVRGCLNCQAELALMRAVTSAGAESSLRRSWPARTIAPLAAAVLLVVAGGVLLRPRPAPELPPAVTTEGEVTRSLAVAILGPVGDQAEAPRRLEWHPVARAVRYRVRLMEVDRREIWSTSTPAVAADLPATVRASLAPGRTLLWDVTAYDASGAAVAESGVQSFRLMLR